MFVFGGAVSAVTPCIKNIGKTLLDFSKNVGEAI